MDDKDRAKWAAARGAVELVQPGMVVGLGTGSTALKFLDLLAERKLPITCVATSEGIASRARELGLELVEGYPDFGAIDLTVDGADEVDPAGNLVKGGGGALLREKLVALASRRVVIVVDPEKNVEVLGRGFRLPIEIVPFGWSLTLDRLRGLGLEPELRQAAGGLFRTDGGNLIADCRTPDIPDPATLHRDLKGLSGVVETGLFPGIAHAILTGSPDGTWQTRELVR